MEQPNEIFILDVSEQRSSLIRKLEYNSSTRVLTVYFRKYYMGYASYEEFYPNHWQEFSSQKSIGKYYLHYIKPNFKQIKMETTKQRPKTKNQASDQKRFIKISINVRDIKKEWLHEGEKGTYLAMTLQMLPDGQLDKYGNLGMITQDVPKSIYEKEKDLPKDKKTQGPILGNAAEMAWDAKTEGLPGTETGTLYAAPEGNDVADDLPF